MAKEMADELENNRLEVMLVAAKTEKHHGHKMRVVVSTNPDWYRKLCARFVSSRKTGRRQNRTSIKRRETLRALRRIAADLSPVMHKGMLAPPTYVRLMLPIVRSELKNIKERRRQESQPIKLVEAPKRSAQEDWEPF
jgi:hypothetical protein